jgi:Zn-finger nucleic acid-binding protein
MKCPKCEAEMRQKTYKGIEIDRCTQCKGIFLDKGELESLQDQKLGTVVDICAYSKKNEAMDEVAATCHRCGTRMMALRGAGDIRIDWCDQCEGIFFDKGELARYEFFKDA